MKPLAHVVKSPSAFDSWANYVGQTEFPELDCLLTQNRDSDCLTRSNWRSALKELGGESDHVVIHRFNHWACGWWEALAVKRGTDEHRIAEQIEARLENYPVVDEQDHSELEYEEANEVWKTCYRLKDRIDYIRKHRSQFDFRDFQDLIGCVRGKWFSGYASELLH